MNLINIFNKFCNFRIDNWINEGSGWVIESVDAEYMNISCTYIELPRRLRKSVKGLINIKSNWTINASFGVIPDI